MEECKSQHQWEITNVQPGFLITEKCSHCNLVSTYFCNEERPPMEEYRQKDHFWKVKESAQTIRFDLNCKVCGTYIQYNELCGLMLCTGCDDECEIGKIMKIYEQERTWIYVAFGFLPVDINTKLSLQKIEYLEQCFNQRRKSTNSRVKFVSYELINNISKCYAEIIKDVKMLALTPNE
jgi:hypothetical protein